MDIKDQKHLFLLFFPVLLIPDIPKFPNFNQ